MEIATSLIIIAISILSAYFAVGYYGLNLKAATEKSLGKELTIKDVVSTKKALLRGIVYAIVGAGFAYAGNPMATIVLAILLVVAVRFVTDATPETARLNEMLFRWLGLPLTVGISVDIVKRVTQFGFGWNFKPFLWFIAPLLYYIILAIVTMAAENNESEEDRGAILPRIIAVIAAVVLIGGNVWLTMSVDGAAKVEEQQIAAEEAARQQAAAAEAAKQAILEEEPADEGFTTLEHDLSPAEKFQLAVANATRSKEEEAILQAGMAMPQLDAEDADSKITDYQLSKDPATERARRDAALADLYDPGTQHVTPVSDSYIADLNTGESKDPETGHDLTYLRTYAGVIIDFCKEINSWATARVFGMYHPDAKDKEFKDELEKREYIDTQMIYLIRNYAAFVELLEEWSEGTTLGEKNYDAFDFFPEGINIADRNQNTGDGVYGVLENIGTEANPEYAYTAEWENVMADFYAWYKQLSYDGTHEWWTRERGYLGPADGTAHDGVEHEFNYATVAGTRANFTTKSDRQTNYPAEIFCFRDKNNGYRVSDFMGINCIFSDAELFTEAPKAKKVDLDKVKKGGEVTVVNYTLPVTQQPSGGDKVTYTASTGEVKKVPTPTSTPKKTPTPTPSKNKKDPSKSSVNNPNNDYGQKNDQATEAQDEWTKTWVQPASSVVAEAQGGNNSDYTQAIENGTWTPSGTNDALDLSTPAGIADATTPWVNPETGNTVTPVVTETTSDGIGGQDTYEPAPDSVATSNDQNYTDNNSVENPVQEYKEPETKEEGGDVGEKTDNTGGVDNADSEVQEENQFF